MSAKVILICGKICSGKSFLAEKLRKERRAVILSVDEITLALFGEYIGEKHDEICERTQKYLFEKSLEIIRTGVDVILDWGFWQREDRDHARNFYESRNIPCEFCYVDVSDKIWKRNLAERNAAVSEGKESAYYVDENLAAKFSRMFEAPDKSEIDIWYENKRSD